MLHVDAIFSLHVTGGPPEPEHTTDIYIYRERERERERDEVTVDSLRGLASLVIYVYL